MTTLKLLLLLSVPTVVVNVGNQLKYQCYKVKQAVNLDERKVRKQNF
jgi:hypothetical protein